MAKFKELYHRAKRDHEMLKEQMDHRAKHTDQFQAEMDKLRQAEVSFVGVCVYLRAHA